jgi:hypothetical protein
MVGYYSATKENEIIFCFVFRKMNGTEISQTEKGKYNIFSHMQNEDLKNQNDMSVKWELL